MCGKQTIILENQCSSWKGVIDLLNLWAQMQVVPVEIHCFLYLMLFFTSIVALHDCNYFFLQTFMKKRIKKLSAIISYITRKLSIFTSFLKGKKKGNIQGVYLLWNTFIPTTSKCNFQTLLHTIDKLNLVDYCAIIFFCWNSI